jgi:peptidoglycan/LPS O-acetylase OafA/YrhL
MYSPSKNYEALFTRPEIKGRDHFACLDGVRSVGLLWVLLYHTYILIIAYSSKDDTRTWHNNSMFFTLVKNGHMGVDVFFVLSGFLIAYLLIKEYNAFDPEVEHDIPDRFIARWLQKLRKITRMNLPRFFMRRVLRLAPVMIFTYAAMMMLMAVAKDPALGYCMSWGWTYLLFLNNLISPGTECVQWAWSIAVEMQFYVISPILVLIMLRRTWAAFTTVAVVVVISGLLVLSVMIPLHISPDDPVGDDYYHNLVYIKTYNRVGPYMFGMLAAYLYHHNQRKDDPSIQTGELLSEYRAEAGETSQWTTRKIIFEVVNHFMVLSMLTLMLWVKDFFPMNWYMSMYMNAFERSALGAIFAYTIYMMVTKRLVAFNWILSRRVFHFLGQISYSGYLLSPLILIIVAIGFRMDKLGMNAAILFVDYITTVVLLILTCVPLYFSIEKPFMNLSDAIKNL